MTAKTVVQAWTQQARNYRRTDRFAFWGIGDLLRGSNVLFNACHALDVRYILDIGGHPVSQVFLPVETRLVSSYEDVEFLTFDDEQDVRRKLIEALELTDVFTVNTNGGPSWPTDPSMLWKNFIKRLMQPNSAFEEHLLNVIPDKPYNAFHFRLGDGGLVRGERSALDDAIQALEQFGETDDIVITDSSELKDYIRRYKTGVRVSNAEPVHTGLSSDFGKIVQTMSDFFLIAKAEKAKSYSVYKGPSGFVVSAARIFDVPLIFTGDKTPSLANRAIKMLKGFWS